MAHPYVRMFNANTALWIKREAAAMIAERNQADDPDWKYVVEEASNGLFFVKVLDEDYRFVGTL